MSVNQAAAAPAGGTPSLWRQRNFLLVWGGQAVSMQGDGLSMIATLWWIKEATGSPAAAATMMLGSVVPGVLLAPLAGAVIDRTDRRLVLMWSDIARGLVTAFLAWGMAAGWLTVPLAVAAAVVSSVSGVFHGPALQAAVPSLVPQNLLNKANSLHQLADSTAQLVAPVLGGVVVATMGSGAALALDAATFGVAALSLAVAVIPQVARPAGARPGLLQDMGAGFRYLRYSQPMLFFMLCAFALVNFALMPVGPLLPFLVDQRLGLDARGFGLLSPALPVGMMIGAVAIGNWGGRLRRGLGVIYGITGIGFGVALLALATGLPAAWGAMALMGLCLAFGQVSSNGLFQVRVAPEMLGRAFAARRAMSMATAPLALLLTAVLSRELAPHVILLGCGILAAANGLGGFLVPGLARAE